MTTGTQTSGTQTAQPAPGRVAGEIPPSGIRAIAAAAWAHEGTIHLHLGEPATATAPHVIEAGDRAARAGRTHYGPTAGLPEFREAIVEKLARDNGRPDVELEDVVVTAGGVGALYAAYRALLDTGDEVLVPDPGWPNFVALAHAVGARAVPYRVVAATGAPPGTDELDAIVTSRTRAIVVNSPSNPTGAVWTAAQVRAVGQWAERRGLWVISDECYDQLGFDGPVASTALHAPGARSVSVFSLSKSYAMTGWRLGYAVAPRDLAAAMGRVQEAVASCVSTVGQLAGVAALLGPQDGIAAMRSSYRRTRDAAVAACRELGLTCLVPGGAFYLWVQVPGVDATRFAFDLIEHRGVAVAPGSAFGAAGAGHVRVSLAADVSDVLTGLSAVARELAAVAR